MRSAARPVVAHYRHHYLARSETFIQEITSRPQRYAPVVVTHNRINPALFETSIPVRIADEAGGKALAMFGARFRTVRIRVRQAALRRTLMSVRPDVVHAHFGEEGVIAATVAEELAIPLVVTFYGFDATLLARRRSWRRRFRRLFARARLVLAEGPILRERLLDLGCPEERTRIVRIPIRLDLFPFQPSKPPDNGQFILLQACRFVEKKGLDLTVRAFARIAHEWRSAELWLLGDGPERARLEKLVDDLGLEARVRFLGMRSHAEYAKVLRRAHIFVQPSRTARNGDGEGGAPTTLLEAQAIGLPIVTSDHADIPFVVANQGALVAREGDVDGISSRLEHLLRNPEEWPNRALAGRRWVEANNDPVQLTANLEWLYDEVLHGRLETKR